MNTILFTGSSVVDQILSVILGTNMFVGAFIAFVLDNTIPGLFIRSWIIHVVTLLPILCCAPHVTLLFNSENK